MAGGAPGGLSCGGGRRKSRECPRDVDWLGRQAIPGRPKSPRCGPQATRVAAKSSSAGRGGCARGPSLTRPRPTTPADEHVLAPNPPDEFPPAEPVCLGARHLGTARAGSSSGLLPWDHDLRTEPRAGSCTGPVEAERVLSRTRDERGQPGQEVQRFEGYRRSPVPPRALHA